MQIFVKNRDLGFFTQNQITAQKFEKIDGEMELVWCNHAGAYTDRQEICDYKSEGADWVTYENIQVCDKCGATKGEYDSHWIGNPEQGVYES